MKINRSDRISGEIQKAIYEIITSKLKNPLITEMFSIVKVSVTNDLEHAKVYVSVYSKNEERKKRTFDEINKSAKQIRYELARMIKARTVPELTFFLDDSMEFAEKINRLLNDVAKGEEKQ